MTNLVFSDRYLKLREFLSKRFPRRWVSGYAKRPSLLFEGVQVRNAIFLGMNGKNLIHSAPLRRWTKEFRPHLMSTIRYIKIDESLDKKNLWPFLTSPQIANVFSEQKGNLQTSVLAKGPVIEFNEGLPNWDETLGKMSPLFYSGTAYNWISSYRKVPPVVDGDGNPTTTSTLSFIWFKNEELRDIAFTLFVSKWMFAWWAMYGDDFHVTRENLVSFPFDIDSVDSNNRRKLIDLANDLQSKMEKKIKWQQVTFSDKRIIKVGNWDLLACKDVLNEIDEVWSEVLDTKEVSNHLQFQYLSTVKTSSDTEINAEIENDSD